MYKLLFHNKRYSSVENDVRTSLIVASKTTQFLPFSVRFGDWLGRF